jgi:hypothetical protein
MCDAFCKVAHSDSLVLNHEMSVELVISHSFLDPFQWMISKKLMAGMQHFSGKKNG